MVINEIFYSIQGEGLLAGVPPVFIRVAGCPLRCTYCDTPYAQPPDAGDDLTIPQIIEKVENLSLNVKQNSKVNSALSACSAVKSKYIVITGGEPMLNPQIAPLAAALKDLDYHITIETAGIAYIAGLACDIMSISPKTSNSRPKSQKPDSVLPAPASCRQGRPPSSADSPLSSVLCPPSSVIRHLISDYPYQLKFVVESPLDLQEIQQFIESLKGVDPAKVMLMPQAKTRQELIERSPMVADLCKNTGYAFCNRLQLLLYDGQPGK